MASAWWLAALVAAGPHSVPDRARQLAPSDFNELNDILSRVKVVIPPIVASTVGVHIEVLNLTCWGARLSDVTLTTSRIDSRTFDLRPLITGVSASCSAAWKYNLLSGIGVGHGAMTASVNNASLAAVLRIIPLDFDLVESGQYSPPPPPTSFHGAACQARSGCNYPCGVTPAAYAEAGLLTASATQCYFCDEYWFSAAPGWCDFKSHRLGRPDQCCVLHDCVGDDCRLDAGVGGGTASPPPPPPSNAPCTQASSCTSGCGITPAEYKDSVQLFDALPNQCYECSTDPSGTASGTCQFRQGAQCCQLHTCSGSCPPPPPPPLPQCHQPSGCNYGCGVTPPEYSITRIPTVAPDQCYYCSAWYTTNAPVRAPYGPTGPHRAPQGPMPLQHGPRAILPPCLHTSMPPCLHPPTRRAARVPTPPPSPPAISAVIPLPT